MFFLHSRTSVGNKHCQSTKMSIIQTECIVHHQGIMSKKCTVQKFLVYLNGTAQIFKEISHY